MCFSATASFVASAGLGGVGVASVSKSTKRDFLLALAPLFFSLQQFLEGILWTVDKSSMAATVFGYGFLFFAYLWWPVYIPLGVYLHEWSSRRRKWILLFLLLGIGISLYLLYTLISYPLVVSVDGHHLVYSTDGSLSLFGAVFYAVAIAGAFLVSSSPFVRAFGLLTLLSWIGAYMITQVSFASVWCFFAAIISGFAYWHIAYHGVKKKFIQTKKRA